MAILIRILIFLICFGVGLYLLAKTLQWVNLVGTSVWAEQHLGGGGTYTMWKLIGMGIIIIGILILAGTIQI
jgi:hypothetical protein